MCQHTFIESGKPGYVVCRRCGTFHSTQFGEPVELYNHDYWSHARGHSTLQEQVYNVTHPFDRTLGKNDKVLQLVPARGGTVLEIACAPGALLKQLADRFDKVYGIEVDSRYEADLRQVSGGKAELLFGLFPAVTKNFAPASVDCIIGLDVFEHVPDGAAFIAECHRLLSPGGTLILMSPFVYGDGIFEDKMFHPVEHVWLYSEAWLTEAFGEHFEKLRFDRWFPGHEIFVCSKKAPVVSRPVLTRPVDDRFDSIACPFCDSTAAEPFRAVADIVKCRSCSTVYLRTRMNQAAMEQLYQSYADDGSHLKLPASLAEAAASPWKRDYFLDEILAVNSQRGPLLDVGCGWGAFLLGARERGFTPAGIEITRKAVRYANEQLQIPVAHTQFLDTPITPDTAQLITMNHVLEHLPQPKAALAKVFASLRPGGLFCGIVPNIESLCSQQETDQWYWLDPNYHYVHYSPATLRRHLETAGFIVEKIYTARGDFDPEMIRRVAGRCDEEFLSELGAKGQGEELRFFARKPGHTPATPPAPLLQPTHFPWPAALDPFVHKHDGKYLHLTEAVIGNLTALEPFYFICGGAGDALLALATFYDKNPRATLLCYVNSIPAMRSLCEAFPELARVYFLPQHTNSALHARLRALVPTVPNALGMGVAPRRDFGVEWNSQTNIFQDYGVVARPAWARQFQTGAPGRRVTLAPRGSLVGMAGSKRNLIEPREWPELLQFLQERGYEPVLIGTPDERAEYPCPAGCLDKRSYSFRDQMEQIASSALFVGADSWGKTFAGLAGIPTYVFEASKGLDWRGQKDPSDFIFLDPWDNITVVSGLAHFKEALAGAPRREQPAALGQHTTHVAWEGSFTDHGSLAHVNRELTRQLAGQAQLEIVRVGKGQRAKAPTRTQVTVRHAWPPNWQRPKSGKWVHIQPWEFGMLPADWVRELVNVDEVWTPSTYCRRVYLDSGIDPAKVHVVPNGIDPVRFQPGLTPMPLPTTKSFKFLFVGGLIGRKGADLLIEAYRRTFTAADDVCLVLKDFPGIYDGLEFTHAAGPEILYFNEDWPTEKLPALYAACDCLVHPYRGEGFGLPVLEAMACGLPVIVTGGGATDDFATDEYAYRLESTRKRIGYQAGPLTLARPGWLLEPAGLAERMAWVVEHRTEARAKGAAASAYVRREWTWERAAQIAAHRLSELGRPVAKAAPVRVTVPPLPAQPRLTVCVITRNEEQHLARCLKSVAADQLVVVDTGSTDRTVEIARACGAEVHRFEWNDDFAAARNAALVHATGDWVLMLDADEELTTPVDLAGTAEGYRLPIVDAGQEAAGCHYVPRLFRRAAGLRYVGRIHEQLRGLTDWRLGTATIRHHGYTAASQPAKNARNLKLLELALREQPDDPNLLMNLGLELARAGRLDAGLEQYAAAWRKLRPGSPELRETLLTQYGTHLVAAGKFAEVIKLYRTAGELTASQHFTAGLALTRLKDFKAATEEFRACLMKRARPTLCPAIQDVHTAAPRHCLAVCLTHLQRFDAADREFRTALAEEPGSRLLRFEYSAFQATRGQPVEALQTLHELVTEKADDLSVWLAGGQIALSQLEFLEFAVDWTGEAVKYFPIDPVVVSQRAAAVFLADRPEAAAAHVTAVGEPRVSREFLKWYRQLLDGGSPAVLQAVTDRLPTWRELLPTAARFIETALLEVA